MPLNWDLSKVRDYEELYLDDGLNGTTKALILLTKIIGIPKITPENVDEVFRRIQEIEKDGLLLREGSRLVPFSWGDVRRHVGMHTNAAPVTRKKFDDRMRKEEARRQEEKQ